MNNTEKYFAEIIFNGDSITVKKAKKLVGFNQHKTGWRVVNSRNLARKINKGEMVIK